jgi:hypothetical protein
VNLPDVVRLSGSKAANSNALSRDAYVITNQSGVVCNQATATRKSRKIIWFLMSELQLPEFKKKHRQGNIFIHYYL